MGKFNDITGTRFHRLTPVRCQSRTSGGGRKKLFWECLCDCGATTWVESSNLKSGNTKSCGCKRLEVDYTSHATTHGMHNTRTYSIWRGMINRCRYASHKSYPAYGGRGIAVCDRWLNFENFFADMGEAPCGLTIERIDNDANYCPANCTWASRKTQQNNRKTTILIEYNGVPTPISELAERLDINYHTLYSRITRGWSVKRATDRGCAGRYYQR